MNREQVVQFLGLEHARPDQEADTHWDFEGKTGSPSRCHIDCQMGVLPVFELVARHPEVAAVDLTEPYVLRANDEVACSVAHGG